MTAVMTAGMALTVVTAGMTLCMIAVMAALSVGIKIKNPLKECSDSSVAAAGYAAIEPDARLCKSHLCTAADATADKDLYPHIR